MRDLLKDHSKYCSSLFSTEGETKKDCSLQVCIPGESYLVMAKVRMDASFKMIVERANGKTDSKLTKEP